MLWSHMEFESPAVLPYLQSKTDFDADIILPVSLQQSKQEDELGLPVVPRTSFRC
ncbi:unnamed protein product [Urochloa humidicola]